MGGFDRGAMGGWGSFGWLGMLIPLLFWGGLLALIACAVVRIFATQANRGGERLLAQGSSAEETLRERFALGEINAEEYEERRRILGDKT